LTKPTASPTIWLTYGSVILLFSTPAATNDLQAWCCGATGVP